MKRILAAALIAGASTFGLVGCEQKSETETQTKIKTPDGEKTIKDKTTIEASGDQKTPPAGEPK